MSFWQAVGSAVDESPIAAMILLLGAIGCVATFLRKITRRNVVRKSGELDAPLFAWDAENSLSCRNLLAGGIHALGRTDGGKTSSMKQIARAILRHGSAMLILCPKKGEFREWVQLAEQSGRKDDVILFDPSGDWRFNMLGYLGKSPAGAESIVRFIMEMKGVIFREQLESGGESAVWRKHDETAIRNCVIALMAAGEDVTSENLQGLITTAPTSEAEMAKESWRETSYCSQVIARGYAAHLNPVMRMDFEQARQYLVRIWPSMGDRTRGSVLMGVSGTLSAMNIGMAREMFSGACNITPKEAIEGRKIVIINMPPDEWGDVGVLANCGWKYHWQKEVLKREISDDSPIAGIWGDESSLWVSEFDSDYVSRCRSYRGFQVYICQSIASYHKSLPEEKAKPVTESLLSNFSHKLLFSLGDYDSAEWAANLCGKELQMLMGGSVQHAPINPMQFLRQESSNSSSFHEQYEYLVRPEEFMSGMRTGSPANNFMVDAWLVRSGVPFSNGLSILRVTFDQRAS